MCASGIPNELTNHHIAADNEKLGFNRGDRFYMKKENGAYRVIVNESELFSNGQSNAGVPRTVTGGKEGYTFEVTLLHRCGNNKSSYVFGKRIPPGEPGKNDTEVWVTEEDEPIGPPGRHRG